MPREPIPRILSELFSERFGSVVAIEDLGLRQAHQSPSVSGVDLPWAGPQTVSLLSEFSRSDLMLARRGFLGTSLMLAAGPSLIEPMQRWLVPSPAERARPARDRRRAPAAPPGSRSPSWNCWNPPPRCSASGTPSAAAGLRRKAVVGQLHEVTDLLQEPQPAATAKRLFTVRGRTRRAGRLDELRRRSPAHRPEVLRARPARRQGGRATSRSARTSCPR